MKPAVTSLPAPPPAAAAPVLTKGLRLYLYVTAAVAGAAVMIVEILGAKMLSPFMGMSHFVWTAQIAVTLVALACGYYAGGRLADQSQRLAWLYWALLASAAYLALTVVSCEAIAYRCLDLNLAVGSLLASTILFFIPLALLAMTGPFLVRVITSTVTGVGGNVGRLISISTLGSFAGTLVIGYVAIPLLPNSFTMYATAAALLLLCAGYFGVFHPKSVAPLVMILAIVCALGALVVWRPLHDYQYVIELFRGNSHFGQLQVVDVREGSCRYYLNDNLIQNTYDPDTKQSESAFTYLLAGLARAYTTNVNDVLCIGLGVGIVPMDFARRGAKVDVVEINPAVVPVGQRFFNMDPSKLHITLDDGRHFLNRCRKQYDVVVLDAFLGDSSPSHLLTREAFAAISKVLRANGTLVINSFGDLAPGRDFFTASLSKTLKAVYPGVRIHDCSNGGIFFVATHRPDPAFAHPPELTDVHPDAQRYTDAGFADVVETLPGHGRVLTDDYNPVEFYDARNREEIRRRLALWAKDM
ncbi:MAG TPA: fused MFS/spermidine synthase [Candidatus Acidoferrum sp.]|nr:fused MFS/spermidine synthase [Candidatus Acidoferrum sp.]